MPSVVVYAAGWVFLGIIAALAFIAFLFWVALPFAGWFWDRAWRNGLFLVLLRLPAMQRRQVRIIRWNAARKRQHPGYHARAIINGRWGATTKRQYPLLYAELEKMAAEVRPVRRGA